MYRLSMDAVSTDGDGCPRRRCISSSLSNASICLRFLSTASALLGSRPTLPLLSPLSPLSDVLALPREVDPSRCSQHLRDREQAVQYVDIRDD